VGLARVALVERYDAVAARGETRARAGREPAPSGRTRPARELAPIAGLRSTTPLDVAGHHAATNPVDPGRRA